MSEFEENKHEIELSGKSYPIKCDMIVLNKVQDKYGDLDTFRFKLSGLIPILDDDGNITYDEDGTVRNNGIGVPDPRPVSDALVWMIQEGAAIAGDPEPDEKDILRDVDIPLSQLKWIVHGEYISSLFDPTPKNQTTPQDHKRTKK